MPAMHNILFALCASIAVSQVLGASDVGPRRLSKHKNRGPARLDHGFTGFAAEKRASVLDSVHIGVVPVLPLDSLPAASDAVLLPRHKKHNHKNKHMNKTTEQKDKESKESKNMVHERRNTKTTTSCTDGKGNQNNNQAKQTSTSSKDGKREDTAGLIQIAQGNTVIIVNDNGNLKTQAFDQFLAQNGGAGSTKTLMMTQTVTQQNFATATTNSFVSSTSVANIVAVTTSSPGTFAPVATGIGAKVVQQLFVTTLNSAQMASISAIAAAASTSNAAAATSGSSGGYNYGGSYGAYSAGNSAAPAAAGATGTTTTANVIFPSSTTPNIVAVPTGSNANVGGSVGNAGNPSSGIGLNVVGTSKVGAAQLSSLAGSNAAPTPAAGSAYGSSSNALSSSSSTSSSSTASDAPALAAQQQQDQQAVVIPGQKLSVLPIGLGVFGGLAAVALGVVGYVTYERRKYRKQFRNRRAAEAVQNALNMRQSQFAPANY